jgi:MFS family permease
MTQIQYKAEKFRWIQLLVFSLVGIQTQIIWIAFAPAAQEIAIYYGMSVDYITLLAAIFMVIYIPMSFIANIAIDAKGLKIGVGIGVYLTAIGGLIKALAAPIEGLIPALAGSKYWICFIGQLIAAIGQPFVLNCWTKLATNWFLEQEKTTAAGLGNISMFFGVIIAMIFPIMQVGISLTLWIYAILGIVIAILYQVITRERPATPPNAYAIKKVKLSQTHGLREMMTRNRDFLLLFIILFIGLGVFNALTSEIDLVFDSHIYSEVKSGDIGALIILGGVFGAIVISAISDKLRKRKIFLFLAFAVAIPLTVMYIYFRAVLVLYLVSFIYGFIMVSCMPVGMTYGAEITYPSPEETSAGLLMVAGQISGILFLLIPPTQFLWWIVGLFAIGVILCIFLRDTAWYEAHRKK